VSLHKGERLPEKWIIDKNGDLSDNPPDYYDGGAILPFGGRVGHKGFGLGIVVDVLSGILARSGPAYRSDKRGNGLFKPEIKSEQRRVKNGIFVPEKTWKEIVETAKQVGVDIDSNLL
jgi:LDH2 family malate/lactate/ureidoglycolate dehydrogenase